MKEIGKYKILQQIASGGMAEIYLATPQANPQQKVIIKLIINEHELDEVYFHHFKRESQISTSLIHNNLVYTYDAGCVENKNYIIMEYIQGKNLQICAEYKSKTTKKLSNLSIAYLFSEVCKGLEYLHKKSIIHRDMSPQNIMLTYDGDIKIIDFGISKIQFDNLFTTIGTVKGKYRYMSPEQARGENISTSTDIFQIGIILFELLTGDRFFAGLKDSEILTKLENWTEESTNQKIAHANKPFQNILYQMLHPIADYRINAEGLVDFFTKMLSEYNYNLDNFRTAVFLEELSLNNEGHQIVDIDLSKKQKPTPKIENNFIQKNIDTHGYIDLYTLLKSSNKNKYSNNYWKASLNLSLALSLILISFVIYKYNKIDQAQLVTRSPASISKSVLIKFPDYKSAGFNKVLINGKEYSREELMKGLYFSEYEILNLKMRNIKGRWFSKKIKVTLNHPIDVNLGY